MLVVDRQHGPAGGQNPRPGAGAQDRRDDGADAVDQVLAVVDHEHHIVIADGPDDRLQVIGVGLSAGPQRPQQLLGRPGGIDGFCQGPDHDPGVVGAGDTTGQRGDQVGLADPARTDHGDHSSPSQQVQHLLGLPAPPGQRRRLPARSGPHRGMVSGLLHNRHRLRSGLQTEALGELSGQILELADHPGPVARGQGPPHQLDPSLLVAGVECGDVVPRLSGLEQPQVGQPNPLPRLDHPLGIRCVGQQVGPVGPAGRLDRLGILDPGPPDRVHVEPDLDPREQLKVLVTNDDRGSPTQPLSGERRRLVELVAGTVDRQIGPQPIHHLLPVHPPVRSQRQQLHQLRSAAPLEVVGADHNVTVTNGEAAEEFDDDRLLSRRLPHEAGPARPRPWPAASPDRARRPWSGRWCRPGTDRRCCRR